MHAARTSQVYASADGCDFYPSPILLLEAKELVDAGEEAAQSVWTLSSCKQHCVQLDHRLLWQKLQQQTKLTFDLI